ncbi:MAG: sugar phosphate isomerase/epimerase [Saprospiraceae bacterium]|nr:sugar phosphate isomerase/epimerase [Saprospiraceae bacterium]
MHRRTFLRSTAFLGAAVVVNPVQFCTPSSSKLPGQKAVGLQVYTLRDLMAKDPEGTLKTVADLGYNYIELFGYREGMYFGKTVKEMQEFLQGIQLPVFSSHIPTGAQEPNLKGTVLNDVERAVADAKMLGQEYLVCPWLADSERKTIDDYKRLSVAFNKAGEVCKQYGIQFCYHNHDFEFFKLDGQIPMDVILAETDAKLVQIELDIYWITKAGFSYADYFKRYPGRFPLWHVKDMEDSPERAFAEVGSGVINWKEVFAVAGQAGMKRFFVEQDVCKRPPLESVKMSREYLRGIL